MGRPPPQMTRSRFPQHFQTVDLCGHSAFHSQPAPHRGPAEGGRTPLRPLPWDGEGPAPPQRTPWHTGVMSARVPPPVVALFQWKLWCVYPMRVAQAKMKPVEWPVHSEDREIPRASCATRHVWMSGIRSPGGHCVLAAAR